MQHHINWCIVMRGMTFVDYERIKINIMQINSPTVGYQAGT